MRQRITIAAILALLIVAFALMRGYQLSKETLVPYQSGRFTSLEVRIPKGTWSYQPDKLEVAKGDTFTITVQNDDDIVHGFALDPYGINMSLLPHQTQTTPPLLAKDSGDFMFYCSVMCGEGMVATGTYAGEKRGHFDMVGTFVVDGMQ